jgi:hypothetical protein
VATVYLLWHVSHARLPAGSAERHRDEDGELIIDEESGNDVKLLGVYSSRANGESRIDRARQTPGFRDEPNCFLVECYQVDHDEWTAGFVAVGQPDRPKI